MHTYRSRFLQRASIHIVIHVQSPEQALENAHIAYGEGAHGIQLIEHYADHERLLSAYTRVREEFPNAWIGLNWLGLNPSFEVRHMLAGMNGLWTDNAGIYDDEDKTAIVAGKHRAALRERREEIGDSFLYFGGIAFKGQHEVRDVRRAASLAVPYMDVIVTSGDSTGSPPSEEKMRLIREGARNHPVAIASGISPENIHRYLPYADCFFVATRVSDDAYHLNRRRVAMLVRNADL